MINPWELPSLKDDLDRRQLKENQRIKSIVPLKQADYVFQTELKNPASHTKRYTYYMLTYTNAELVTFFRKYFGNQEELINKNHTKYYSFTFDVDDEGKFIEDSLDIPHVQLIVNDVYEKGEIDYKYFTDNYIEKKNHFLEELTVIFQNSVDSTAVEKAEKLFIQYFGRVAQSSSVSYVQCHIIGKNMADQSMRFNSFYLDDLQAILKNNPNKTLEKFIEGVSMETDIDENRKEIENILSPKNLPEGRWPSPVNYRLSLMQQVAVNQIIRGNESIHSVNGPPGTGKTTLLKDIFAQLIVERAKNMVKHNNPQSAFTQIGKQSIKMGEKNYDYSMFKLDPEIAKYSMVVASSNNGAVENISKELPLLDEIVRFEDGAESENEYEEFDRLYAEEAKKLDFFPAYAENLLGDEKAWGLFSGAFGKSSNISNINKALNNKSNGNIPFLKYLESEKLPKNAWETVVQEFNALYKEIEFEKMKLEDYIDSISELEKYQKQLANNVDSMEKTLEKVNNLEIEYLRVNKENTYLQERLDNLPEVGLFTRIIKMFTGKMEPEEKEIREERDALLKKELELHRTLEDGKNHLKTLKMKKEKLSEKILPLELLQKKFEDENITLSTDAFWGKENYDKRQISVLWQTDELNFKRGLLFLKALQVHKVFLHENHKHLKVSLQMLNNLRSFNLNIKNTRENIEEMWKTLHLVFPIMSTTFASFSSMYRGMGPDLIDYLFIDEAGQASPQQAAGALWRSKKAIVVGDPLQIEPVVTLDETILADIRDAFDVSKQYIGPTASVQVVADHANPIGTYKGDGADRERIGIPLWVHRRCIEPMFSIANDIAYENKMVLAMNKIGNSEWHNISGKTKIGQYVPEQGEFVLDKLKKHFSAAIEGELPNVFVITPFTAVRKQLISLVNRELKKEIPHISDWTSASIGTVHTFQGKEADIVYFVTGTDAETEGAANWSCMKPNLLNVAVTRAKKEFYVVGDLERYREKQYYDVIVNLMDQFKE